MLIILPSGRSEQRLMKTNFLETVSNKCPVAFSLALIALLPACTTTRREKDRTHVVEISVPEQRMAVYREGEPVKYFPISTSKFGLGDDPGSNCTPIGKFEIAEKIGDKKRPGTVFKSRKPTGEVVKPNSPGRDPIVSRILWLKGLEETNRNAFGRYIYIHGTPEERTIGTPASYGCIRMKSKDVIDLYDIVGWGADVYVVNKPLWQPTITPATQPELLPVSSPMALAGAASIPPAAVPAPHAEVKTLPPSPDNYVPRKRNFEPILVAGNTEEE